MSDGPSTVAAVVFILYFTVCGLLVPVLGYTLLMEKRDCELVNESECAWKMLPKENKNDR